MEAAIAEQDADCRTGEDVAEKVHAEDDARGGDAHRDGEQHDLEVGVKQTDGKPDGERSDGVPGRKRVFIGR